jgi:hypothetical protein
MNFNGLHSPVKDYEQQVRLKCSTQLSIAYNKCTSLTKTNICLVWKDGKGTSKHMDPVIRQEKLYSSLIKTDFKTGLVKWDKEVHFTLMKCKGHQDEIIISSIKQKTEHTEFY